MLSGKCSVHSLSMSTNMPCSGGGGLNQEIVHLIIIAFNCKSLRCS